MNSLLIFWLMMQSPAPYPDPVLVLTPLSYRAACDVTDKATGTQFRVDLDVAGFGKRRIIAVKSAEPSMFPEGRFKAKPLNRIGTRHIEVAEVKLNETSLGFNHQWYPDSPTSDLSLNYVRINEAVRWPVRGKCVVSFEKPKS